ncbi:Pathogenesis-related protein 1C [Bienertia sinuspersici]
MVWENSVRIGCAIGVCGGGWPITNCQYDPPGNIPVAWWLNGPIYRCGGEIGGDGAVEVAEEIGGDGSVKVEDED